MNLYKILLLNFYKCSDKYYIGDIIKLNKGGPFRLAGKTEKISKCWKSSWKSETGKGLPAVFYFRKLYSCQDNLLIRKSRKYCAALDI